MGGLGSPKAQMLVQIQLPLLIFDSIYKIHYNIYNTG